MKKVLYLFLCFLPLQSFTFCSNLSDKPDDPATYSDTLKVATYNIRISTTADKGNLAWTNRKAKVAQLIKTYNFDIVGTQEVLNSGQEKDLQSRLTNYACFSKGRDNTAGTEGERLAVFYKKNRFKAMDKGFFFISPTPEVAGKGWDAALNRICIWMKLYDVHTQKTFFYFDVHLDHMGVQARSEGVKLVVSKIKEMAGTSDVIFGGDFNANPAENAVYQAATSYLDDSRVITKNPPTGTVGTFNGWDMKSTTFSENQKIDYIFLKNADVISYAVLNDKYVADAYPSDHFPVFITCVLK
jgi:endonuclease/exonuclease/phosphatase family metal-dependent hydrolase